MREKVRKKKNREFQNEIEIEKRRKEDEK